MGEKGLSMRPNGVPWQLKSLQQCQESGHILRFWLRITSSKDVIEQEVVPTPREELARQVRARLAPTTVTMTTLKPPSLTPAGGPSGMVSGQTGKTFPWLTSLFSFYSITGVGGGELRDSMGDGWMLGSRSFSFKSKFRNGFLCLFNSILGETSYY